ncbi:ATP-binding cassette domain-containing protein [Nonomuraea maheshkhaliensis]|uniref:ATP-binding cassette domain-containing protein n=1 Tax=Nonomuraea maheshkhaliensis TaxID=419590 RepID=UPI003D15850D
MTHVSSQGDDPARVDWSGAGLPRPHLPRRRPYDHRRPHPAFAPGERVALMGPSGSGKTTLPTTPAGLLPPAGGPVLVRGVPLDEWRQ